MPRSNEPEFTSLSGPLNSGYEPRFEPQHYRIGNGLYLVTTADGGWTVSRARDIHRQDSYALLNEYRYHDLPYGTKLRVIHYAQSISYALYKDDQIVFRARYALEADELIDVRTAYAYQNKGYARAVLAVILSVDGPTNIRVMPSRDSPVGFGKLINFYASFPGYHAVPGTNKVIRLMREPQLDSYLEEAAAGEYPRRQLSDLELSIYIGNTKELNRLVALLQPMNEAEVQGLLQAQKTDLLSLQTAMEIYTKEWFDQQLWSRTYRVMFAQGMADLLWRYTKRRNGVWDDLVRAEAV